MKLNHVFKNMFRSDGNYLEIATEFVNSQGFNSETEYLIWVDLKNFKTNIFKRNNKEWVMDRSFLCSIGKPSTPTPTGTYKVGVKGLYFGVEHGYKCFYYTQFFGDYLFHSIIYNLDGSIRDDRLGKAISNGCVRLQRINAKWIYDNIPEKTSVIIGKSE